ncbi:hypothetical protein FO519_006277 [Halicephalobus sp. NKZ332]|nr:hypothetical protein FO519_006277 [Halicephalobus sp. NKZ332]
MATLSNRLPFLESEPRTVGIAPPPYRSCHDDDSTSARFSDSSFSSSGLKRRASWTNFVEADENLTKYKVNVYPKVSSVSSATSTNSSMPNPLPTKTPLSNRNPMPASNFRGSNYSVSNSYYGGANTGQVNYHARPQSSTFNNSSNSMVSEFFVLPKGSFQKLNYASPMPAGATPIPMDNPTVISATPKRDRMDELRQCWKKPAGKLCCALIALFVVTGIVLAIVLPLALRMPNHYTFNWQAPEMLRNRQTGSNNIQLDIEGDQARFNLRGAVPFHSNFISVYDFKSKKIAIVDSALQNAGRTAICFVMDLNPQSLKDIGDLKQAAKNSVSKTNQTQGWQEAWNYVPSPITNFQAASVFKPDIQECRNARWVELNFVNSNQKPTKCSDCYDFCLPDYGIEKDVLRNEEYLNIVKRDCFYMFVPEWKNYAQSYPNPPGQNLQGQNLQGQNLQGQNIQGQVPQQGYPPNQQNPYGQQPNLALPGYNPNAPYGVQQQGQNPLLPGQLNQGVPQQGFGTPGQPQQGFGTPGQPQPGFGTLGQPQSGFGTPGQPQQGFGNQGQPQPGFGNQGQPQPGFGNQGLGTQGFGAGGGGGVGGQPSIQGNPNQSPQESRWISLSGVPQQVVNRTGDVLNQARQQVSQWGQQVGQSLGILPNNQQNNGFTPGYNTNNQQNNPNGFDYQRQIVQPPSQMNTNGALGPAYNVQQQGQVNTNSGLFFVTSNGGHYPGHINSNNALPSVNSNDASPSVNGNSVLYSGHINSNSALNPGNGNGYGDSNSALFSSDINSNSGSSPGGDGNSFYSVRTQRTDQGNRWPGYSLPVESFLPHNINPRNTPHIPRVDPYGWNDNYKHAYYTRLSQSFFAHPNLPSPFPASPYGPQSPQQRPLFPSQIFNPPSIQEQNERIANQQNQNILPNSPSDYFRQTQNTQLTPQQQMQLAHSQQTLGLDLSATMSPSQAQLNKDLQFLQNFGR